MAFYFTSDSQKIGEDNQPAVNNNPGVTGNSSSPQPVSTPISGSASVVPINEPTQNVIPAEPPEPPQSNLPPDFGKPPPKKISLPKINLTQRKNLFITLFVLAILGPTLYLAGKVQLIGKKAAEITVQESVANLKPLETDTVSLAANNKADTEVSLENGALKVIFKKDTLNSELAQNEQVKFSLLPQIEENQVLRFSLELEGLPLDRPVGGPSTVPLNLTTPTAVVGSTMTPFISPTTIFNTPTTIPNTPTNIPTIFLSPTTNSQPSPTSGIILNLPTEAAEPVLGEQTGSDLAFSADAQNKGEAYYTIEYALSELKGEYAPSTFKFVWFNPQSGNWDEVPTTIDYEKGVAIAKLNHFSEGAGKAQKAQVFAPTLKTWEASLYTGAVTYSFPIEVVPGIGGLAPSLAVSYNSNLANALSDEQKGGWLGAGWNLSLGEIRFDSYENKWQGDCEKSAGTRELGPQYTLVLAGVGGPLVWVGDSSEGYGRFITKGGNAEIKGYYGSYKGKNKFGSACEKRNRIITKWVVMGTNGTEYTFNVSDNSLSVANRLIDNVMVPTSYMVTQIKDLSGNTIDFEYQVPQRDNKDGQFLATYPAKISYNGGRSVVSFTVEEKKNHPEMPYGQDKNLEMSRLASIVVFSDESNKARFRTYNFLYREMNKFDALQKIEVYATGNPETKNKFVTSEFEYEIRPAGLNYEYISEESNNCLGTRISYPKRFIDLTAVANWLLANQGKRTAQQQRLYEAGFESCAANSEIVVSGCPMSAKNEYYTVEGVPSGVTITTTPAPDGRRYYTCTTITMQGSVLTWEKAQAPFLTKVKNGYGGEVVFTYKTLTNTDVKVQLNRNVVISKETFDRQNTNTPSLKVNYDYESSYSQADVKPNKGGGFSRVTLIDPQTQIKTTTYFYPLAAKNGDGGVDPEKDPFYGLPLRTVTYKEEGRNKDKIYTDQFTAYSVISPYNPNFGLSEEELAKDNSRQGWQGWTLGDNLLASGFGKTVTTVADSFVPKNASFIIIDHNNNKPQFIPTNIRLSEMNHSQSRSFFDRYGYTVKSVQLGDVSGNFEIGAKSDLSQSRETTEKNWWKYADQFTFGTPFSPLLLTGIPKKDDKAIGSCMKDGELRQGDPCHLCPDSVSGCKDPTYGQADFRDVCCTDPNDKAGAICGYFNCANIKAYCDHNLPDQCLSFKNRETVVVNPPASGKAGSLQKYSYVKYLRDPSYLALNMTGLASESFLSDKDSPTFDAVPEDNRWGYTINTYDSLDNSGVTVSNQIRGFLTGVTKKNTASFPDRLASPDTITSKMEYDQFGNVIETSDAKGFTSTTEYVKSGKAYDNILPAKNSQTLVKEDGKDIKFETTTTYNDLTWLPDKVIDANGVESQTTYDCLGRVKDVYKPDPISGNVDSGKPAAVSYLYFDYQGEGCGNGIVSPTNPLPHLRTKTRISTKDSDDVYLFSDQISDGLGQTRQTITAKTKINGEYKSVVSLVNFNNRGLKESESLPIEQPPLNIDPAGLSPLPAFIVNLQTANKLTTYTYDELGRAVLVKDPLNHYSRTDYAGFTTTVTDPNNLDDKGQPKRTLLGGAITSTQAVSEVNGFGQSVKTMLTNTNTKDSKGFVTYQKYDLLGNVVEVEQRKCGGSGVCSGGGTLPALSVSNTYYDHLGRKYKITDPDLGTWKYAYDLNGNLVSQVDNKGQEIKLTYDSLNRLIKKEYPGNARGGLPTIRNFIMYIYDKDADDTGKTLEIQDGTMLGKNIRIWDTSGDMRTWYDKRGRVTATSKTIEKVLFGQTGSETSNTAFEYYDSDNLKATILPTGERVEQELNEVGQLTGVKSSLNQYLQYQKYNVFGSPLSGQLGNGREENRQYDQLGRLQKICLPEDCSLLNYTIGERDNVGNILKITNDKSNANLDLSFAYDSLYQLKSAQGAPYNASYIYDPGGNMTQKNEGSETVNMEYTDTSHKHAPKVVNGFTYQYDANGNLIEDEERLYEWDFDNKPVKITMKKTGVVTEFAYDGQGNRVVKRVVSP